MRARGKQRGSGMYFERNVVISDTDLQFLLPDDILFGPVCVIFPRGTS